MTASPNLKTVIEGCGNGKCEAQTECLPGPVSNFPLNKRCFPSFPYFPWNYHPG